jgi:uracil-DNA glycosylase family 4
MGNPKAHISSFLPLTMNQNISRFFNKYERACQRFNRGPIHIPKPDQKNGTPGKKIVLMFINERPGRIGPGKSDTISFENPDPSARRFKSLFKKLGVNRKRIFITNTCIYYPLKSDYRDRPLSAEELKFSLEILKDQIMRVKPKILVPLGNTALGALKKTRQSKKLKIFTLSRNIGESITDVQPYIFPLYHTSNRAAVTRSEKEQEKDWQKLNKFISTI